MSGDGSTIPLWIAFGFFLVTGFYFAGAESAFSAVNKMRIKAKAEEGNKRAKCVMFILNHFDKMLNTLLVGNNISHIAAASVATLIATELYAGTGVDINSISFSLAVTCVTTAVVFLLSEMIPKALANDRSETVSILSAGSLRACMRIFTPITAVFGVISGAFAKLFHATEQAPSFTEDELIDILDTVEEEGVVDEVKGDMLKSALEFGDTTVGDVMTMAKDIRSLNAAATNQEILNLLCNTRHSRIPVYAGTPEHIIGTLRVRRFLTEYHRNPKVRLRTLLSAPYFVKEDAKINDVLTDMRQHKHHMAIVADEKKNAIGLVTIEDFLEELVGEIFDEEDVVDKNFQTLGGNYYRVNTQMLMGTAFERMGIGPAPRMIAGKPILSFMLEQLGHLPGEGDTFLYTDLEFTVDTVEENRATFVIVHILDEEDLAAHAAAAAEGGDAE